MSRLFEKQTAVFSDSDVFPVRAARILDGNDLAEKRGPSQPPSRDGRPSAATNGRVRLSEPLEQAMKHLVGVTATVAAWMVVAPAAGPGSTQHVDADTNQRVIDGVTAQARRHEDPGNLRGAGIHAKPDIVRPLQPDDSRPRARLPPRRPLPQ